MDQLTFRNLVADEIKCRTTDMKRRYLVDNPERWISTIEELRCDLDSQLERIDGQIAQVRSHGGDGSMPVAAAVERELDLDRKRSNIERFGRHVDARLAEIRDRFADLDALTPIEREVRLLRRAIEAHRRLVAVVDDTDAIDAALYAVLQGEWHFPEAA